MSDNKETVLNCEHIRCTPAFEREADADPIAVPNHAPLVIETPLSVYVQGKILQVQLVLIELEKQFLMEYKP